MTEFVSSLSSFNLLINNVRDNRINLDKIGQQVSTGKNSANLADLTRRAELLDLRETKTQTDAYANAIGIAQTKANALDTSLTRIIQTAQSVIQAIDQFNPNTVNPNLGFISNAVTNAASSIAASMNTRVGNVYIFAGSRYSTQPVNANAILPTAAQLAAAPYNAAVPASVTALGTAVTVTAGGGAAYPVVTPSGGVVPDYDSQFPAAAGYTTSVDPNQLAYAHQALTIQDQRRVTYGINSTDSVFQDLVTSLRAAANGSSTAPAPPGPANWLQLARTGLQNVVTQLQSKQAQLGAQREDFQTTFDHHTTDSSNLEINISKITDIDVAKASTSLLSIQSQFQGSLTVTKTLLGLSLVNYLR
jgi:flagellin-like hook-associated protein FlgL